MDLVAMLKALSNYDDGPHDLTGIITPPECAACGAEAEIVNSVTRVCDDCDQDSFDEQCRLADTQFDLDDD